MTDTTFERSHALDAVRGAALILGIFFHAGLAYYPGDQVWLLMDPGRSLPIAWLGFTTHIFRMTIFFFLAGYFGHLVLSRHGALNFVKSRSKRVLVPLVIFWPLMMTALTVLLIWSLTVQYGVSPGELPPPPPLTLETLPLTHLWFLYVLVIFYVAVLIFRIPLTLLERDEKIRQRLSVCITAVMKSPLLIFVLAVPTTIGLLTHENWVEWFGIPTPDYGIIPHTSALISYGIAFGFGWFIFRAPSAIKGLSSWWLAYLIIAISATGTCLYMLDGTPSSAPKLMGSQKSLYAALYALAGWAWSFGLIGLALRVLNKPNPAIRYIADSSYWLYLIHLPIIMAMQVWMFKWEWSAMAKYGFVLATSLPIMLLSYQLLVRHSFIGNLLNGPRRKKPSTKDAAA